MGPYRASNRPMWPALHSHNNNVYFTLEPQRLNGTHKYILKPLLNIIYNELIDGVQFTLASIGPVPGPYGQHCIPIILIILLFRFATIEAE